jgi:glucosamine 6-phosphate synthetase-like amidotransferase/phosphosugar isomerase protein
MIMHLDKISAGFPDGKLRSEHPYYMYAAIQETPDCLQACMQPAEIAKILAFTQTIAPKRIFATGCGTSFNACLAVAYTCRALLHLPAQALDALDMESEFIPGLDADALVISISHSGNTPATCRAQAKSQAAGAHTVSITGFPESRLAKSADLAIIDPCGREIPYGKTRSYLSGAFQGMLVAAFLADAGTREAFLTKAAKEIAGIKAHLAGWETEARAVAEKWAGQTSTYLLAGYGVQEANSEEVGLKMIEVLGEVACGFGLEEFCHGASASFRQNVGVIVFQTEDKVLYRALQIGRSVMASHASILVVSNQPQSAWPDGVAVISIPNELTDSNLSLFPAALIGQLLFYFISVARGYNPDVNGKDRNPELVEAFDLIYAPAEK